MFKGPLLIYYAGTYTEHFQHSLTTAAPHLHPRNFTRCRESNGF